MEEKKTRVKKAKKAVQADTAEDRAAMTEIAKAVEVVWPVTGQVLFGGAPLPSEPKEVPRVKADKKLRYYLTLFKVKNHEAWRACLKLDADGFDKEVRNMAKVQVTEVMPFAIDRITGVIEKI